jgi:hypothetical protein
LKEKARKKVSEESEESTHNRQIRTKRKAKGERRKLKEKHEGQRDGEI